MKKEMIALVAANALFLPAMFILPVISVPEYSIIKNTIFELGSQSAPYSWTINLIFILLALGSVYGGWNYYQGLAYNRIILLIFGLSLVLAALLNSAPVSNNIIYNIKEAEWHTYFESTAILSFIILSLSTTIISEEHNRRLLSGSAGLSIILLSVLISESDSLTGICNRLIFIIIPAWFIYTFGIRKSNGTINRMAQKI